MNELASEELRYRRAALRREVSRADARAHLAAALAELDAVGTHYRLFYPQDHDRPDWQGGAVPASFSHLDWRASAPSLEIAIEDRDHRTAVVLAEIVRRTAPEDRVLVTISNGAAPQIGIARADFERHAPILLDQGTCEMWLSAPSSRWLVELRPPWVRVAG